MGWLGLRDLVNLILCGRAVTNVFNNRMKLDEHTVLNGILAQSKIGFLTLFEWYKYVEVGSNYKCPKFPVWVICCESHFSCFFAESNGALADQLPFSLQYYDGLAMQDEVIRLSVTRDVNGGHTAKAGESIGDRDKTAEGLTPPLEFVIETRWPGVKVDWNGADPIL
ncbi:hypothetical protein CYMTET_24375 [Cymbomonas tetramitiformis]|uniref:Deubiquitinating enzyme MINDY-3/4 conserved domain-containing protein n=1 Tax=Cymbomonas tetramitiformis TaxID=36881 RepID=A0AAE0L002_9CHLO|nr:hypothetical protein CYMTET_24375 [Cymbomonas tetramitiformis]